MNQATKTQIENEAAELYPSTFEFNQVRQDRTFYKIERESYIAGATKYAELLEQEKAKGEKLVEALEEMTLRFERDFPLVSRNGHDKIYNNAIKALTEYKK